MCARAEFGSLIVALLVFQFPVIFSESSSHTLHGIDRTVCNGQNSINQTKQRISISAEKAKTFQSPPITSMNEIRAFKPNNESHNLWQIPFFAPYLWNVLSALIIPSWGPFPARFPRFGLHSYSLWKQKATEPFAINCHCWRWEPKAETNLESFLQ